VLDANILIRGVLGFRVFSLINRYADRVSLVAPGSAFDDAREKLPGIIRRRAIPPANGMATLDSLAALVQAIGPNDYDSFETAARRRLKRRDEDDWPILASALAFGCPIWTEDLDFFGCGVATWTSDRVEIFLEAVPNAASGSTED